ncbi:beta-ketoacyl-[acyl-carrier-protein] synthase family protein [Streptomyces sp. NRRL S-920]|uniref:beta-ketoacyl-[acyl-carrier-protein] synthase family protein n=1 Tax=Streptomyces sp. NRRL S-920 TaxID=1463921 RepID=UPI0004C66690|nr:beta-ketoacyl-[acyl-carrier-protein] synthase family protein [Streptomyces sp. NRRL S-920]
MSAAAEIAVTGIGLVTAAGVGVSDTWRRLCEGTSTAAPDPELTGLPVPFACRVPAAPVKAAAPGLAWRADPFISFAVAAAREAVADAGLDPDAWDAPRVAVVIGVGGTTHDHSPATCTAMEKGRFQAIPPTLVPRSAPNMAAGYVGMLLSAQGPTLCTSTACASGATAIGTAALLLRAGMCDIAIAGGSESASPVTSASFWRMGALSTRTHDPAGASRPFDSERDGFVLGEGAGVLVLERASDARSRRARPYALLTGYGATGDAYHATAPHPEGLGAQRAVRAALTDAGLSPQDIDHVNAHATSTTLNDRVEARALHGVFGTPPPVTATKSVLGHSLGAAGAIEAAVSALTLRHQLIHPTANLDQPETGIDLDVVTKVPRPRRMRAVATTSFGFGGQNAALVFQSC